MTTILEFDYETYSDIDLKKLGLDLYSAHPSTEALMAAYRIYESGDAPGDVQQWQRGDGPLHATVVEALLDPHVEKWGFNSSFERVITRRVLKIKTPYSGWRCGMVLAYMQSFVGGLDDVGKQMQLSTVKSGEGKRLINKFSMPQRVTKANTLRRRDEDTDPDDWQLFLDYNRQDVLAEHEIRKHLIKYPILADEWYLYEIDQRINDRGMPIDMQFVENAIVMSQHRKDILKKRMIKVIGADDSFNPNSTAQLLPWLVERGYPFQDLRKDTVKKVITEDKEQLRRYQEEQAGFAEKDEGGYLTREARAILKLRQQAARTADRKYTALKIAAGSDFRMRFCFQFAGASRTSRWAGRRFQPHNLTRTPKSFEVDEKLGLLIGAPADYNLVCITDAIRNGDEELLELLISEPLDALAGAVRSSIRAPEGYELHDCDLKSIESVVIGWLAGCERLLQVFRDGKDPYIDFGTELYKKPYEEVTKTERNNSKPPVLGCFGADTLVFTQDGTKRIADVTKDDLVFDGVEWVTTSGAQNMGVKSVIDFHGVQVTPDHRFLVAENYWRTAWDVHLNTRLGQQAIDLAIGLSKGLSSFGRQNTTPTTNANAQVAERLSSYIYTIWNAASHSHAPRAPMLESGQNSGVSMNALLSTAEMPSIGWQIGSTPSRLGAEVWVTQPIDTPGAGSNALSPTSTNLLDIASPWMGGMTQPNKSIGETMTEITRRKTCGSSVANRTTGTKNLLGGSSTRESVCAPQSFTSVSVRNTETSEPSPEKSARESLQKKSSMIRSTAKEVTTFDLINCGPRSRFMIVTEAGPLVVHNCGFRLSGGELKDGKKTGLWGYAENMGIELTREECHEAVAVFRSGYHEIPKLWYALEEAIARTVTTGRPTKVGKVSFEMRKPYLCAVLPSGRRMYYYKPRITKEIMISPRTGNPYTKLQFSYMGKQQNGRAWIRVYSHGGKVVENLVQAIARDILKEGMIRAHEFGFNLIMHVHDALTALQRIGDNRYTAQALNDCMVAMIDWCPDMPFSASPDTFKFYRK